jgi:hypothetical protein
LVTKINCLEFLISAPLDMRNLSGNEIAVNEDSLPLMLLRGDEKAMSKLVIRSSGKSVIG